MPQVKPSKRAVHVIGPVQEPLDAVRNILKEVEPGSTVVDLSAGQFISLAGLHEEAKRKGLDVEKVKWIDGHDFTDSYGEVSRKEYVRWLSEQANEPLFGGKSIKEAFVYREEVALWWFGEMSVKQPEQHPYRWLFFMIFVLQDVREHVAGATWHLWVPDERTGTALNGVLRDKEISIHLPDMAAQSWKLALRRSRLLMGMYSILRAVYQWYGILRSVWGHRSPTGLSTTQAQYNRTNWCLSRRCFPTRGPTLRMRTNPIQLLTHTITILAMPHGASRKMGLMFDGCRACVGCALLSVGARIVSANRYLTCTT